MGLLFNDVLEVIVEQEPHLQLLMIFHFLISFGAEVMERHLEVALLCANASNLSLPLGSIPDARLHIPSGMLHIGTLSSPPTTVLSSWIEVHIISAPLTGTVLFFCVRSRAIAPAIVNATSHTRTTNCITNLRNIEHLDCGVCVCVCGCVSAAQNQVTGTITFKIPMESNTFFFFNFKL